jgi:hypothetical protein
MHTGRWVPPFACAVVGLLGWGCAAGAAANEPPPLVLSTLFADQTPPEVPRGALDAVVMLYDQPRQELASAIVVAPNLLLTAAHVVEHATTLDDLKSLAVEGEPRRLRVVACGDKATPHGDWALLAAAPEAAFRPVATLHAPALRPDWAPAPGTPILLVGFAAGFFPERRIDVHAPTPSVRATIDAGAADAGCWVAHGDPLHLGGMSGGAAMVWNEATQLAEVIGVFSGYVTTEIVEVEKRRVLGILVGESRKRRPGVQFMVHRLPPALRESMIPGRPAGAPSRRT